jgi:hypothetical protein
MNATENREAVMHCIELFNKDTLEWVDTCYSKDLEWNEMPTQAAPQGRQGNFQFFRESAAQILKLFPDQKLTVLRSISEDNCVVLEQEWHGTASASIGKYVAGHIARLKIVSFFTLDKGLIVKQTDYCTPVPTT